jgi:hypothetical protein
MRRRLADTTPSLPPLTGMLRRPDSPGSSPGVVGDNAVAQGRRQQALDRDQIVSYLQGAY